MLSSLWRVTWAFSGLPRGGTGAKVTLELNARAQGPAHRIGPRELTGSGPKPHVRCVRRVGGDGRVHTSSNLDTRRCGTTHSRAQATQHTHPECADGPHAHSCANEPSAHTSLVLPTTMCATDRQGDCTQRVWPGISRQAVYVRPSNPHTRPCTSTAAYPQVEARSFTGRST